MTGTEGESTEGATPAADTPDVVEYCANNVRDSRAMVESLPAETRCYPCLERCGRCRETAFLVVDGDVLAAESHGALVERLGGEP